MLRPRSFITQFRKLRSLVFQSRWRAVFGPAMVVAFLVGTEAASGQSSEQGAGRFSTPPGAIAVSPQLADRLWTAYKKQGEGYLPRTEHVLPDGRPVYINRLILEDSPYLIQHAHNPVDWYPWGPDAFNRAQLEGKPIFLSIGYSTCHWCHVMEKESFDDEEVARFLNENFVAIKVDREQRPDVDEVYMTAVQLITGRGGWPMSSLLTSEGKPFFGATYFPRAQFLELLQQAVLAWRERRPELIAQAARVADAVAKTTAAAGGAAEIGDEVVATAATKILVRFDSKLGGFSKAPKFPHEPELLFLLGRALRSGDQQAIDAVEISLDHMARGGIYDQVGGGFHRYSTDERWLVPHFEKMLYNQAHLARAYLQAFRLTANALDERVARQTLDYVLRDMTSPEGAFFSATDADSEGKEGEFFVWTPTEIRASLAEADAKLAMRVFGVTQEGNFEGKNILSLPKPLPEAAVDLGVPLSELLVRIDGFRQRLYEARERRIHPLRDEKIVTAWNAMMATTLAEAGNTLGEARYLEAARRAIEFLWRNNRLGDGRLWRAHLAGNSSIEANQNDYAYLVEALVTLHDATGEAVWLQRARSVADVMIELFWDGGGGGGEGGGGFFMSADDHQGRLLVRPKSPTDGALPSGNSVAIRALAMLAECTGEPVYRQRSQGALAAFGAQLRQQPTAFGYMLLGADELLSGRAGSLEYGAHGVVRAAARVATTPRQTAAHRDGSIDSTGIEIELELQPGWHINSNEPLQEDLSPTRLVLSESKLPGSGEAGSKEGNPRLSLGPVEYPRSEIVALGFQDQPLAVFQGRFVIRAAISAARSATNFVSDLAADPVGRTDRPLVALLELTIQACDDQKCLLPEDLIFEVPTASLFPERN